MKVADRLRIDHGFLSPHFVTNMDASKVVLENTRILLSERPVSTTDDLLPFIYHFGNEGTPLVVIAADVGGEALATLIVNQLRGTLSCAAVRADKCTLAQVARLTGATLVRGESGLSLADFGHASRVIIDRDTTDVIAEPEGCSAPD